MAPRKPPTPEELWRELEDEARGHQEVERIAALPRAQLEEELAKAGFDVPRVKAEARALREEIARSAAARRERRKAAAGAASRARRVSGPSPARSWRLVFVIAAVAAVAAGGGGGMLYVALHRGNPAPAPTVPRAPAPPASPEPTVPDASPLRQAPSPDSTEKPGWK